MDDGRRDDPSHLARRTSERFCCLSFHGTVLGVERATGKAKLRTIGRAVHGQDVHVARTDGDPAPGYSFLDSFLGSEARPTGGVQGLTVARHARTASGRDLVTLSDGASYVTADCNATVRRDTSACRDWEVFMLVRAVEIDLLDRVFQTRAYLSTAAGERHDLRRSGMGQGYTLHLEGRTVGLSDCGDLCGLLREASLLAAPDAEPDTGEAPAAGRSAGRPAMRPIEPPRIHVFHLGHTANRALQYLVAENLRSRVDGAIVSGVDVPEWSVRSAHAPTHGRVFARLDWDQADFDLPGLADCLARGVVDTVYMHTYPFNLHLYPPLATARRLLPHMLADTKGLGFGDHDLVCNIRGGEILRGAHDDYPVMPPRYYRSLQERSGLELVFYGQLGDDPYANALRAHFPTSRFIAGTSPQHDFEVLRRSRHIAVGISTFSWLAAWLSEAETVYLPICGMFSPVQMSRQSYLPWKDPRYRFTLLPYAKMVDIFAQPRAFNALQELLADHMRPVSAFEVERLCLRAERFKHPVAPLRGFDNDHYLAMHPGAARDFYERRVASPVQHFIERGHGEGLSTRVFDGAAYLKNRPDVAMAIAEGHFADPLHHASS